MTTVELSDEEVRELRVILLIIKRKATRGPFWAHFAGTVRRLLECLP